MSHGTIRYWVSWYEPYDKSRDVRPMTWPLPADVQHYWKSGEDGDGTAATLCAVVDVDGSKKSAMAAIERLWKPREFRFVESKGWASNGWMPEPSRFPAQSTKT